MSEIKNYPELKGKVNGFPAKGEGYWEEFANHTIGKSLVYDGEGDSSQFSIYIPAGTMSIGLRMGFSNHPVSLYVGLDRPPSSSTKKTTRPIKLEELESSDYVFETDDKDSAGYQFTTISTPTSHVTEKWDKGKWIFFRLEPSSVTLSYKINYTINTDHSNYEGNSYQKTPTGKLEIPKVDLEATNPALKDVEFENEHQYKEEEPDWNRLGRHEGINKTSIAYRLNNKQTETDISWELGTWDEPDPYYNAYYPDNKVIYTHNGLLIEIDDTADNRRFHVYHPSNTYFEISENGNVVFRNSNNRYEIIDNILYKLVKGDMFETVEGSCFRHIKTDNVSHIIGNELLWVESDRACFIDGTKYEKVNESKTCSVDENIYKKAGGSYNVKSSSIDMDAGTINLNCGTSSFLNVPNKEGIITLDGESNIETGFEKGQERGSGDGGASGSGKASGPWAKPKGEPSSGVLVPPWWNDL